MENEVPQAEEKEHQAELRMCAKQWKVPERTNFEERNYLMGFIYTRFSSFQHLVHHYSKFNMSFFFLLTLGKFWFWAPKLNIGHDHYFKIFKFHNVDKLNICMNITSLILTIAKFHWVPNTNQVYSHKLYNGFENYIYKHMLQMRKEIRKLDGGVRFFAKVSCF